MKPLIHLILSGLFAVAAAGSEMVVEYDSLRLSGRLRDNRAFELCISRERYRADQHPDIRLDGSPPTFIVSDLFFSIDGRRIAIPAHAFRSLGDPSIYSGPYLMQDGQTINLYIPGGDGAGGYTQRITIRGGKFVRAENTSSFDRSK